MQIEVKHFFSAAHQLPDSDYLVTKACARLHGHTYCVIVKVEGPNARGGMVVDFKAIKNIIDELDHQFINDIFAEHAYYKDKETTAENIADYLFNRITIVYPSLKVSIKLAEGYKGDNTSWVYYE